MLLLNNLIRLNFNKFSRFSDPNFVIKKMLTAAHIKIFMNFSQTITILTSLNLNWQGHVLEMFNIHKSASGGFQEVVSVECFFTGIIYIKICIFIV